MPVAPELSRRSDPPPSSVCSFRRRGPLAGGGAAVLALAALLGLSACSSSSEVTSAPSTTAAGAATSTAKDAETTTSDADGTSKDGKSKDGNSKDGNSKDSTSKGGTATTTEADDPDAAGAEDGTDDGSSDGVTPACDLLTEEDVTEALGEPVTAGDQRTDECWWATANDLKTVNLIRRTDEDLQSWREGYDNPQWKAADFGDEGYRGKTLDSIVFRIGDTIYEVNVVFSTKGDAGEVVESLAERVLTRL